MTENRKVRMVSILLKSGESLEYLVYNYKLSRDVHKTLVSIELEHADDERLLHINFDNVDAIDVCDDPHE